MRSAAEILVPWYLTMINFACYRDFAGFGNHNPIKKTDIVINSLVDVIRVLAISFLVNSPNKSEIIIPILAGYVIAGVAMKLTFDGKIQSRG
jgi:hypothetical protein